MLTFKQFIAEMYLIEASFKHFSHLNLDPNNPEHKDLIDAYNSGHSSNDPNVPRHPGQIKSVDQFQNAVKQHLEKIQQKRKESKDDAEAFQNGEANVIHHNPETGAKVTQVSTQAGSVAAGAPDHYCTGRRGSADMVRRYDPEGNHSFLFHFPKEKDKNLRTIGAYGKYKPNGANFQNAENHELSDEDWNYLTKKHGLNKVKHLKGVVRGIGITKKEKDQYANELTHNIKNGTASSADVKHASTVGYLTDQHKKDLLSNKNTSTRNINALASDEKNHEAILNHPNTSASTLKEIALSTKDVNTHKKILDHKNVDSDTIDTIANITEEHHYHDNAISNDIYNKIARNRKSSDKTLGRLTSHNNVYQHIKNLALKHKNAGDETLEGIAKYSKNPEKFLDDSRAGDNTLSIIAGKTNSPDILRKLLSHPKVGKNTLPIIMKKSLSHDDNNMAEEAIKHKNNDSDSLSHMAYELPHSYIGGEPDERTKGLIHHILDHQNVVAPHGLTHIISRTADHEIYNKILKNPSVTEYNLEHIAKKTKDSDIIQKILDHKNTTDHTLSGLGNKVPINTLINHPKTGDHTLASIANKTSDPKIHNKLLDHKECGKSTLDAIAQTSNDSKIHNRLVENPNTPDTGLSDIAHKSNDPEIHKKILQHENNYTYPLEYSIKKIHDPEVHRLMLEKYGHQLMNKDAMDLVKKYKLPQPYIQKHESKYDDISQGNLANLKHHLSKLAARTETAKNRNIDTGTKKEPLVTPIKSRQRRYNFTESYSERILRKFIGR